MIGLLCALTAVLLLLLANEWWWQGKMHGEASRKFIHITVGTFVAFWPLFLSWRQIEIISVLFVAAVLLSRKRNIFRSLHAVDRLTWGEVFFGLSVGAVALIANSPALFTIAILHMSLADGFAAVIGTRYGGASRYRIFGSTKTRLGTLTFLIISVLLLMAFSIQQSTVLGPWLPVIAIVATVLENVGIRGIDNLLIPVFVAVALQLV